MGWGMSGFEINREKLVQPFHSHECYSSKLSKEILNFRFVKQTAPLDLKLMLRLASI